jgi:hypothetical protein
MIDLAQRTKPHEVALPYGLSVTVKPRLGAPLVAAAAI